MPDPQPTPSRPAPTPESAHEPVIVRVPSAAPRRDPKVTSLVVDNNKLTVKAVLRFVIEVALVLAIPCFITVAIGLIQMAKPQMAASGRTPADEGLQFADAAVNTADGLKLAAWDVAPKTAADNAAIVVLPGHGMDKGGILARTAFLAQRHRLLYVDLRSIGGSEGSYATMGINEIADVEAAVRHLREQGVRCIGVYGFTVGGAAALNASRNDASIAAIVTEDAIASYALAAQEPFEYAGPLKTMLGGWLQGMAELMMHKDSNAYSPANHVGELRGPLLVIQSENNPTVPATHGQLLRDELANKDGFEYWQHHGETDVAARMAFAEKVSAFFGEHLARCASGQD